MNKIFNLEAMKLAEGAIRVKYVGKFAYAAVVVDQDGGTDYSPLIKLGVSDTSLAAAVSAAETVFTSTGATDIMNDIINAIRWWKTATSGAEVRSGEFECEALHCLANSTTDTPYSASAYKFANDAGTTTNFADGSSHDTMLWDNDSASVGHCTRRIPPPAASKGSVTIAALNGQIQSTSSAALAQEWTKYIYDDDGNILWQDASIAVTLGETDLDWTNSPVSFTKPVIVRDQASTPGTGDVDYTSGTITWAPALQ